ncbi:MAG: rhodanese-like domain-containing protein [Winogradskyella sp.]|uniref:rhodanese-like domain-containing protein n=1 Tax=Winogradskyella sp. TaxID=1883156 RepID=UPI000F3D1D02|nr:rhodanese-like domain-containing protein [Winogradskyella sp.]RNC85019.1 MAG: rhodanese-like domain-containing protein [Winogradskyella sp.]
MKQLTKVLLTGMLVIFITSCVDQKADSEDIKLVTADEMKTIIEREDVQLIDVRTPSEFESVHIKSAQNIDFRSPTFDADIQKLDKSKPVLLYCKSGGRSAKCAKKLKDAGFEKVYDLDGGISKWEYAELLTADEKS